MTSHSEGLI